MATAVAEYGMALYKLSVEENLQPTILGDVRRLIGLFEENPAFVRILGIPSISKAERMATVDRVFEGQVHPYVLSFLKLLIKRERSSITVSALKEYERLWYEYSGIAVAEVTSAVPLGEEQKMKLHSALEKKTGRDVEMHVAVDPSMIGGVRVMIDGQLIEDSVRKRINDVKRRISETVL